MQHNNQCTLDCKSCADRLYSQEVPIFESLAEEELIKVVGIVKNIHLKKGDVLITEGELISKLFIISDGNIKISKNTLDGKEQIINILGVGDVFGEANIIGNPKHSNVSAIALREGAVCSIDRGELREIVNKNPEIALKILDDLSMKMEKIQNMTTNLSTNNPEARIACMLLEFASKYGSENSDGEVVIEVPINKEGMSNYCGIARETLSRKLSFLDKNNIISLEGKNKIIIIDIEKLEEFME